MTATIETPTATNNKPRKGISHEEALEIANAFIERDTFESIRNFARECAEHECEQKRRKEPGERS